MLAETVALLPGPYREVLELRFGQELSTRETAERLAISRSNVATRLERALRLLRERFAARTGRLAGQPERPGPAAQLSASGSHRPNG